MSNIHGFSEGTHNRNHNIDQKSDTSSDPLNGMECSICIEKLVDPVMTSWGHIFWYGWLNNWFDNTAGDIVCPTCRVKVDRKALVHILGDSKEHDHRYNQEGAQPQRTTLQIIWAAVVVIFTSGFGVMPLLEFLKLGQFFGDRPALHHDQALFERRNEKIAKTTLVVVLMVLILFMLFAL